MKPRIADLEKQGVAWCCEYDLAKLLRLARAAKAHYVDGGRLDSHLKTGPELLAAIDAFDWDDDVEVDDGTRKKSKA